MQDIIKTKLEQAQTLAIFWHARIDGDAVGSMFGLGRQLEKLGKQVFYYAPEGILNKKQYDFLPVKAIQPTFDYGKYDLLVFVDFSEYTMISDFIEGNEEYFDTTEKIIIDHHLKDMPFLNSLILRDSTAISCCEIIFELTQQWRGDQHLIDIDTATFLYMGIVSDSGNLFFDEENQTERILLNLLELLRLGARKKDIIDNRYRRKSFPQCKFTSFLLDRMVVDGEILYTRHANTEKEAFATADIPTEEISAKDAKQMMQNIAGIPLVIMGRGDEKGIRISLRGRGKYSCNEIAKHFKGGGHFNAAGCKLPPSKNVEKEMKKFVEKVKKLISK